MDTLRNQHTTTVASPRRIRHQVLAVFLLGGIVGSSLNVVVSAILYYWLGLNPLVSFFTGAIVNQLFHHFYYHVLCVNQEIRMRTALPIQLLMYVCVAALAVLPLWALMHLAGMDFLLSVLGTIVILSVLNVLINRISTFGSARAAQVEYRAMDESFYQDQTDASKVGDFRAWYHRSRQECLAEFIAEYYTQAMKIADLGCGNCLWNVNALPIVGVDINENMLRWAQRNGRLIEYHVRDDLSNTALPEKSFDMIVMSETIEHLPDMPGALWEARRILTDDGTLLVTVPYDFFLGPFFIMFNLNCLYQGYIKGSDYHKFRCGHIHHFTKSRIRKTLAESGFEISRLKVVNHLLLYVAARKTADGLDGPAA